MTTHQTTCASERQEVERIMGEDREQMLTVGEVGEWLRVHPDTVRRWIDGGELPGLKVGRTYRVPESEVEAMVTRRGRDGGDGEAQDRE